SREGGGHAGGGRVVEDRVERRLAVERLREVDVVQAEIPARPVAQRAIVERDHGRDGEGEAHDVLVLGKIPDRDAVHDGANERVVAIADLDLDETDVPREHTHDALVHVAAGVEDVLGEVERHVDREADHGAEAAPGRGDGAHGGIPAGGDHPGRMDVETDVADVRIQIGVELRVDGRLHHRAAER